MKYILLSLVFLIGVNLNAEGLQESTKETKKKKSMGYKYKDTKQPKKVRIYQYRNQLSAAKVKELKTCYDLVYKDSDIKYCVQLELAIDRKISVKSAKMVRNK